MERKLPYSDWCYVCGKDNPLGFHIIFSEKDGHVIVRHKPELHRQGYPGVVHGGVLGTLLDEAMGWVPALEYKRFYVTGELTVRFIKPFPVEKTMIVECRPEKTNRRMALISGEVRDEEGAVYATAQGKYLPLSEEETRNIDEMLIYDSDTMRVFDSGDPEKKSKTSK